MTAAWPSSLEPVRAISNHSKQAHHIKWFALVQSKWRVSISFTTNFHKMEINLKHTRTYTRNTQEHKRTKRSQSTEQIPVIQPFCSFICWPGKMTLPYNGGCSMVCNITVKDQAGKQQWRHPHNLVKAKAPISEQKGAVFKKTISKIHHLLSLSFFLGKYHLQPSCPWCP